MAEIGCDPLTAADSLIGGAPFEGQIVQDISQLELRLASSHPRTVESPVHLC